MKKRPKPRPKKGKAPMYAVQWWYDQAFGSGPKKKPTPKKKKSSWW